jgi:hypothetical protein
MKLRELQSALQAHSELQPRFQLPDGDQIPAHAHITEVGYLTKRYIDCGGVIGQEESVVLQAWVGEDTDHRLTSGRFAKILQLGARVLPNENLHVAVEYDCCVVAQYPIVDVEPTGNYLDILLGSKRTQCLARERLHAQREATCCTEAVTCC